MKKTLFTSLLMVFILTTAYTQNIGIGTTTPEAKLEVVGAATTSTNGTIHATNTGNTGNAVLGVSNNANTIGVRGTSSTGTGIQGFTSTGTALVGVSLGGTAIYAQSSTGYGLSSSGKLKFSGGNTNPSDGALLTSDADGNATWKRSGLAFSANIAVNTIPGNVYKKVEFSNEVFDTQNNFNIYTGTVNSESSVFTAPFAGIYHFTGAVLFEKTGVEQGSNDLLNGVITLELNGGSIANSTSANITHLNSNSGFSCYVYLSVDADVKLNVGDKVWIEAANRQNGNAVIPIPLNSGAFNGRFSGELIFAE